MRIHTHAGRQSLARLAGFAAALCVLASVHALPPTGTRAASPPVAPQVATAAEFKTLQAREAEARADMSRWLRETTARDAHLLDRTPNFLSQRMEHRIQSVTVGYADFLARHPAHVATTLQQAAFGADMAEDLSAIRDWEAARAEQPDSPAPWNQLAHVLAHDGRTVDAFVCFEKSLELAPREAHYFFDFATAMLLYRTDAMSHYKLSESELFDRVLLTYRRGLKLEPENFARAAEYAQTFYVIRPARPDEAQAAWEHALKLATDDEQRDEARTHLARQALQAGKLGIARLYLDLVQDARFEPVKESLLRRIEEAAKAATKSGS